MNLGAQVADRMAGEVATSTPPRPIFDHTKTMKALVWEGKKSVRVVEKPRPAITDPKDVIIKITATTICGSDLHLFAGNMPDMHSGDILGHEFMGIIAEKGQEVRNLQIGQRVVVAFDIACGTCDYCKREEYTACDTTNPSKLMEQMYGHRTSALFGYSHLTGGVPGGQAEFVRVPFAEVNCLAIPNDVPDEKALYLSDIVPTSLHGVELGGVKEGSKVGIWGLGPVGLLTARWCQIRKAGTIIAIDCVPQRLELAKSLGIQVIDFKNENVLERISQLVPGGFDVSIECVGFDYAKSILHRVERALMLETDSCDVLNEMITATRKFGVVSIIGAYAGYTNHFPIGALMEKGLHVTGSQSPTQKYWKYCLDMIRKGEMDPTFVVTTKGTLEYAPELYQRFNDKDGVIKVFLRPQTALATTSY